MYYFIECIYFRNQIAYIENGYNQTKPYEVRFILQNNFILLKAKKHHKRFKIKHFIII